MELKKSKEADLEGKKIVFRTAGLLITSAIVLMAFTYQEAIVKEIQQQKIVDDGLDEEMVYEMIQPEEEPPVQQDQPPPPPELEEIEIVEDDEEIEDMDLSNLNDEVMPVEEEEEVVIQEEAIVDFAEVDPMFPGGEVAMVNFIRENIVYPELSREMGEQGTVYVQFVVNSDGSIQDVVVLKGVSDLLDKEAVRVVKKMPKWTPGEQAGKKIRVRYQIPIKFTIA